MAVKFSLLHSDDNPLRGKLGETLGRRARGPRVLPSGEGLEIAVLPDGKQLGGIRTSKSSSYFYLERQPLHMGDQ